MQYTTDAKINALPDTMRDIALAAAAGDRAAYDAALNAALQEIAQELPESDYVDGVEVDALEAFFQRFGFDGIPAPREG